MLPLYPAYTIFSPFMRNLKLYELSKNLAKTTNLLAITNKTATLLYLLKTLCKAVHILLDFKKEELVTSWMNNIIQNGCSTCIEFQLDNTNKHSILLTSKQHQLQLQLQPQISLRPYTKFSFALTWKGFANSSWNKAASSFWNPVWVYWLHDRTYQDLVRPHLSQSHRGASKEKHIFII